MRRPLRLHMMACLLAVSHFQSAFGNECDCTATEEQCSATIQLTPTGSTKGLYGADLHIQASSERCAKVEYLVDQTPYFTVLQGGVGEDRVQGTSQDPLTNERVKVLKCVICAAQAQSRSAPTRSTADEMFGDALNADSDFDAAATDMKLDEIQANDHSPSVETLMGIAAGAQQLQSAVQAQEALRAKAEAEEKEVMVRSSAPANSSTYTYKRAEEPKYQKPVCRTNSGPGHGVESCL